MNNEVIERAVVDMKELYTRLRGLTARNVGHSAQHEEKWFALAYELIVRNLNPCRYIKWAYDFFRRTNPDVYVTMITSLKMVRVFAKDHPDYEAEVRLAIRLQADTMNRQLALGRSPQEILEDKFLELGPVFRYIVALQFNLPAHADQLRGPAELDLACEPLYHRLIGGMLRRAKKCKSHCVF
ncbi:hypothetical protein LCGC14_0400000 [marine sediment metagenome]|uniref:Uncharacterized protein n=1 Tax=marine sediment metagenome TaxID=412755 RepID=A0A0F9W675_9ZZZZ